MKYRKQTHRYIYANQEDEGHIISYDADVCFCGKSKDSLKKLAKKADVRLSTVTKFREDQGLCHQCQQVLKSMLKKEYGIEGW